MKVTISTNGGFYRVWERVGAEVIRSHGGIATREQAEEIAADWRQSPTESEDLKPAECGRTDEGWFITRNQWGRFVCWSDAADEVETFSTREEAERYWADAAEASRALHAADPG